MIRIIAVVLLVAVVLPALGAAQIPPRRVIITAFGPFAGRGINGSETLARRLAAWRLPGVVIETAVWDVRWGHPADALPALLEGSAVALLLGLGEGHPGFLAIETRAVNRRQGDDERGQPPPAATIEDDGPAERLSRLSFAWSSEDTLPLPIVLSRDAGLYLCNEALYTALGTDIPRVGFIHLPPQGQAQDDAYLAALEPIVRRIIAQNLQSDP